MLWVDGLTTVLAGLVMVGAILAVRRGAPGRLAGAGLRSAGADRRDPGAGHVPRRVTRRGEGDLLGSASTEPHAPDEPGRTAGQELSIRLGPRYGPRQPPPSSWPGPAPGYPRELSCPGVGPGFDLKRPGGVFPGWWTSSRSGRAARPPRARPASHHPLSPYPGGSFREPIALAVGEDGLEPQPERTPDLLVGGLPCQGFTPPRATSPGTPSPAPRPARPPRCRR
jgi:hypothetical protein